MKQLALFGRWTHRIDRSILNAWKDFLDNQGVSLLVEEQFAEAWSKVVGGSWEFITFRARREIEQADVAFVIGGDGAFLDAARVVAPIGIPLVGIHAGRLGFLTEVPQEKLIPLTESVLHRRYTLDERSLLQITTEPPIFQPEEGFALNEVTFSKSLTVEMILIDVYLNGELINTYWADGLIVATPTGSTAYSLACGGPILTPQCANFLLTPIAPHSLTIRTLVIPDSGVLSLTFRSHTGQIQIALDGKTTAVPDTTAVALRKAQTALKVVRASPKGYFETLRDRLAWGSDRREW
ncbi:MAG: NAD(+)/NADH kinase [Bacteroidia bacterium]|nr:NAD(+)/NADH kinase [Bacteroidia bacterium]